MIDQKLWYFGWQQLMTIVGCREFLLIKESVNQYNDDKMDADDIIMKWKNMNEEYRSFFKSD